jgi:hypothetical protein
MYSYGRSRMINASRFPQLDHPPLPPWWRVIAWLGVNAHLLLRHRTAGVWVRVLALRCGNTAGSLRGCRENRSSVSW